MSLNNLYDTYSKNNTSKLFICKYYVCLKLIENIMSNNIECNECIRKEEYILSAINHLNIICTSLNIDDNLLNYKENNNLFPCLSSFNNIFKLITEKISNSNKDCINTNFKENTNKDYEELNTSLFEYNNLRNSLIDKTNEIKDLLKDKDIYMIDFNNKKSQNYNTFVDDRKYTSELRNINNSICKDSSFNDICNNSNRILKNEFNYNYNYEKNNSNNNLNRSNNENTNNNIHTLNEKIKKNKQFELINKENNNISNNCLNDIDNKSTHNNLYTNKRLNKNNTDNLNLNDTQIKINNNTNLQTIKFSNSKSNNIKRNKSNNSKSSSKSRSTSKENELINRLLEKRPCPHTFEFYYGK